MRIHGSEGYAFLKDESAFRNGLSRPVTHRHVHIAIYLLLFVVHCAGTNDCHYECRIASLSLSGGKKHSVDGINGVRVDL